MAQLQVDFTTDKGGGCGSLVVQFTPVCFVILGIGEVDHVVIYDWWRVKVFERDHFYTADRSAQWDGRVSGQPAPAGVYAWFAEMSCPSGGRFTKRGTVVLVR
jgi:hypothetical protein